MDNQERANRFGMARTGLNQNGEETKTKVYELTGVPASALVDYENAESSRPLNLDYVQRLADHYGVNAAWLLGQSECWSLKGDIRQISEQTGLSPEAIWALQDLMKDEKRRKYVNGFIASEEFSRMVYLMSGLNSMKESASQDDVVDYTSALSNLDEADSISFSEGDIREMKIWKASRALEKIAMDLAGNFF